MDFAYYFSLVCRKFWIWPVAGLVFVGILYWIGITNIKTLSVFFVLISIGAPITFPFSPWRRADNIAVYPEPIFGGYRKLFPRIPGWLAVLLCTTIFLLLVCSLVFVGWALLSK